MLKSRHGFRFTLLILAVCPLGAVQAQTTAGGRTAAHANLRGTILRVYPHSVLLRDVSQREHIVPTRQSKVRLLNRKGDSTRLTVGDEVVMTGPARSF